MDRLCIDRPRAISPAIARRYRCRVTEYAPTTQCLYGSRVPVRYISSAPEWSRPEDPDECTDNAIGAVFSLMWRDQDLNSMPTFCHCDHCPIRTFRSLFSGAGRETRARCGPSCDGRRIASITAPRIYEQPLARYSSIGPCALGTRIIYIFVYIVPPRGRQSHSQLTSRGL